MPTDFNFCDGVAVLSPDTAMHKDCPLFDRLRSIETMAGVCPVRIRWPMRSNGQAVRLTCSSSGSTSLSADPSAVFDVVAKLLDCTGSQVGDPLLGAVVDGEEGIVEIDIPCDHPSLSNPGLYQLNIGILAAANNNLLLVEQGFFSTAPTAFQLDENAYGPPTLQEIRAALRDSAVENSLLGSVEYTNQDILMAVQRPIAQWNETSPHLRNHTYSCINFPFKYYWMQAIIAELMFSAAHYYLRNKAQTQTAGFNSNDKDKDQAYLFVANTYRETWLQFMRRKKVELNLQGGYAVLASDYGSLRNPRL